MILRNRNANACLKKQFKIDFRKAANHVKNYFECMFQPNAKLP